VPATALMALARISTILSPPLPCTCSSSVAGSGNETATDKPTALNGNAYWPTDPTAAARERRPETDLQIHHIARCQSWARTRQIASVQAFQEAGIKTSPAQTPTVVMCGSISPISVAFIRFAKPSRCYGPHSLNLCRRVDSKARPITDRTPSSGHWTVTLLRDVQVDS
jgi:hypothetical protein